MKEEKAYSFAFFIFLILDPCDTCLCYSQVDFRWRISISYWGGFFH